MLHILSKVAQQIDDVAREHARFSHEFSRTTQSASVQLNGIEDDSSSHPETCGEPLLTKQVILIHQESLTLSLHVRVCVRVSVRVNV
jgi:hypothetical protein